MTGFADYHAHMFSELSFGQYLFDGKSYPSVDGPPEQQLAEALAPCRHGELRHTGCTAPIATACGSWS